MKKDEEGEIDPVFPGQRRLLNSKHEKKQMQRSMSSLEERCFGVSISIGTLNTTLSCIPSHVLVPGKVC